MASIENKPINVGARLASMVLDHFFMTIIAMIFFLPIIISNISETMKISHSQEVFNLMNGPMMYISFFGFALYFCKDIINGRSIAKRIIKLQVVDNKTGQVATPLQSLVRNILCVLWPIEVIIAMTNTTRRLGDRVAGTKLVPYDPTLEQPRLKIGKLLIPILISYGVLILFSLLTPTLTITKTNYNETSYNPAESKGVEKLIVDSLGQYMIPDVRVYDTVKNENLKYVSVILKLKENYIADDNSYDELHTMTTEIIYSKFPKETFTGQIKYVYKGKGQFQVRTKTIGTYIQTKDKK